MQAPVFSQTPANTQIKNIASVTYSDATTNYSADSNEVIITVAKVAGLTITPDAQAGADIVPGQTTAQMTFRVTNTGNFTDDVVFKANGQSLQITGPGMITSAVFGSTDIFTNSSDVTHSLAQNGFIDVVVTYSVSPTAAFGDQVKIFLGDESTNSPTYDNVAKDGSANEVATVSTGALNGSREARGDITSTVNGADLVIAKSHTGNFVVGGTGVYKIEVSNDGNIPSSGVATVVDTLPTGLTVNGGAAGAVVPTGTNAADWTCNSNAASPQVITCTSSVVISNGNASEFDLTVAIGNSTPLGTNSITNTAEVSGGGDVVSSNNVATDPTTVNSYGISGQVFEDINYGGGAGRDLASSSGVLRPNARVELYNGSGNFMTATNTDPNGKYNFTSIVPGSYTVRVVNSTVTSSRTGSNSSLIPVQTYRTDGSSGSVVAEPNKVGGEVPSKVDAGNGSTTLGALASGSNTPQSIATITVGSSSMAGVDFGFNFDTIVNTNNQGQGSAAQFITNANALSNAGLDQEPNAIWDPPSGEESSVFMIPSSGDPLGRPIDPACSGVICSIVLKDELPTITSQIAFDARSQFAYSSSPVVELVGNLASPGHGVSINGGDGSKVRGLTINSFDLNGVNIESTGNIIVELNYIGTDVSGTAARANQNGIYANSGSKIEIFNNLISGNDGSAGTGIEFYKIQTANILGNKIGTDVSGTSVLANGDNGIYLNSSSEIQIGGIKETERNIISGNKQDGIHIVAQSQNVNVVNNYIGTQIDGVSPLGNGAYGISVRESSQQIRIGGDFEKYGNVISSNNASGVLIEDSREVTTFGNFIGVGADGTTDLGNGKSGVEMARSESIIIGGDSANERNIISGNDGNGVSVLEGSIQIEIKNNYIGVDISGATGVSNLDGIYTRDSREVRIVTNVISGNNVSNGSGIDMENINDVAILGNIIGLDATGTMAIGNNEGGIRFVEANQVVIGGTGKNERNIISASLNGAGISGESSTDVRIQNNYIGTSSDGMTSFGNKRAGIYQNDVSSLVIGGNASERNVVSGNQQRGIDLYRLSGATVLSNFIGVAADGETRLANGSGGMYLGEVANSIVGSNENGNVVVVDTTTDQAGILIEGNSSTGNKIQANSIGVTPSGTVHSSSTTFSGGIVFLGGDGNLIGGTSGKDGNIISGFMGGIVTLGGKNNEFRQNSIYGNHGLGIDHAETGFGVTLNDANDADTGANDLLNFPIFESVTTSGGNITIKGCAPTGSAIELFKTDIAMGTASVGDNRLGLSQDYGEGQVFIQTLTEGGVGDTDSGLNCATDADGNNQTAMSRFSFTIPIPSGVSNGDLITATATLTGVGTSEFNPSFSINVGKPDVKLVKSCPSPANCTTASQPPGTDITFKIEFSNNGFAPASNLAVVDRIPTNTDYKIGSAALNLGTTGLTTVIEYSDDYDASNPSAATWTYVPVSGAGGADAGYDGLVKAVRWRVTAGNLSNVAPDNIADLSFVTKIR